MGGKAMSSNESRAYEIMTDLNVDYVLVIFGGVMGYSGDDINKFLWMVRIAEGEHPNEIKEANYMSKHGFGEMRTHHQHTGYDRVRGVEIGHKNFKLKHLEEAYTTEHWIVRIYRVKNKTNRNKKMAHKPINRKKAKRTKKKGKKGVFRVTPNQANVSTAKKTRKITRKSLMF